MAISWVLTSRSGEIVLPAEVTDRMRPAWFTRRFISRIGRQRRDHRELRLGHELPGIQGDGR